MPIDIYKEYNFEPSQQPSNNNFSMLENITNSAPVQGVLGAGDAMNNMLMGAGHLIASPFMKNQQPFVPMQSGNGAAYNVGNIAGNVAGAVGGGELFKGMQLLDMVPGLAKSLGGFGALGMAGNPNDPLTGLKEGLAGGAIGEAIPGGIKGIGKIADALSEKFVPQKATNVMVDELKNNYNNVKDTSEKMYNSVINKYKDNAVDPVYINKEILKGKSSDLYDKFVDDPSIFNAHKLQSQLNKQAFKVNNPFHANYDPDLSEYLISLKDNLKSSINNKLEQINPLDSNKYKEASDFYAKQVMPYRMDKDLYNMVSGKSRNIEPNKLANSLSNISNQTKVPENHFISQVSKQLKSKINEGEILGKVIPGIVGGGIGALSGGLGAAGGTIAGVTAGKYLTPQMAQILSSQLLRNGATKLSPYYDKAKTTLLSNLLQGNQ